MSYNDLYSLRNDKLSVKLRESQMTASTIGKIFNVFPQSIVLIGDDGSVATPDGSGEFSFLDLTYETSWTINGDPSKLDESSKSRPTSSVYAYQQPASSLPGSSGTSKKWKPASLSATRNKPPGVTKQEKKSSLSVPSWTKTLEICSYDVQESVFKKTFNLPLTLTEDTSTVNKVADIASAEAFGGDAVIILDSDNLRIPDSAGTRGEYTKLMLVNDLDYSPLILKADC